jgi:hypothetical protein
MNIITGIFVSSECQQLGVILNLPSLTKLVALKAPSAQNRCIAVGSLIPCGSDWNRNISYLTKQPIYGMPIVVEKATSSCISVNECLEWLAVLPFSPINGTDDDWVDVYNV